MDMTVVLGLHELILQATMKQHGPFMYSDHYNTYINCCKNFILQQQQNYGVWNELYQNSSTAYVVI